MTVLGFIEFIEFIEFVGGDWLLAALVELVKVASCGRPAPWEKESKTCGILKVSRRPEMLRPAKKVVPGRSKIRREERKVSEL
jgi:hypothetical protein